MKQTCPPNRQLPWIGVFILTLTESIPKAPGIAIRRSLYRFLFARFGSSIRIHGGVTIKQPQGINLGHSVNLHRGVCLENDDRATIDLGNRVSLGMGTALRTERNSRIDLHTGVIFDRGVDLRSLKNGRVEIGSHTYVGPYTCIAGPGPIRIGRNCLIASHCGIYGNQHKFDDLQYPIKDQGITYDGIEIGDDCWLGCGVKILDGIRIGRGSIIGAGAVVTKDIPSYAIAVGVPAKVIARRDRSTAAVGAC